MRNKSCRYYMKPKSIECIQIARFWSINSHCMSVFILAYQHFQPKCLKYGFPISVVAVSLFTFFLFFLFLKCVLILPNTIFYLVSLLSLLLSCFIMHQVDNQNRNFLPQL